MRKEIDSIAQKNQAISGKESIDDFFYSITALVMANLPEREILLRRFKAGNNSMPIKIGEEEWRLTMIRDQGVTESGKNEVILDLLMTPFYPNEVDLPLGIITDKDIKKVIGICTGEKRLSIHPFDFVQIQREIKENNLESVILSSETAPLDQKVSGRRQDFLNFAQHPEKAKSVSEFLRANARKSP